MPDPADTYIVGGAALPLTETRSDFQHDSARGFQAAALEWIHNGEEPVGLLAAPTGGGKTAIIAELAATSRRTLCLYPTNALAEAQATTLREEHDLAVDVLTGKTLSARGASRSQEVMSYATDPAGGDVVLTNPDVLQAILQDLYFSPGSELLRFFAHFDAAVYDEFHYYDPLAASGLLMQIKVLSERGRYLGPEGEMEFPRVLLPSATPSRAFVDHVEEDLELSVQRIRSSLAPLDLADPGPAVDVALAYELRDVGKSHLSSGDAVSKPIDANEPDFLKDLVVPAPPELSRFRYPMVINRWDQNVEDSFGIIAEALKQTLVDDDGQLGPRKTAVIFNSAARSNRFQEHLLEDDVLADGAVKDNGYDTGADRDLPDDFSILNTTSKGEVGLDYDLDRLVMVSPYTASDFVQRIGRAARHSPAIVDVYGLRDPLWPAVQSYPAFLRRVVDALGDRTMDRARLRDLVGLRAAAALTERFSDDSYHVDDVREDFGDFDTEGRWRSFLSACSDALDVAENATDPFAPTLDRPTAKVVTAVNEVIKGLRSLRGRSIQHEIRYPLGDRQERTEYDLITALRHYPIDEVDGEVIILGHGDPGRRTGAYPGDPSEGQGIDLGHSHHAISRQLQDAISTHVSAASWRDTELDPATVLRFLEVMDLGSAMLPETVTAGSVELECSENGEVTAIRENI